MRIAFCLRIFFYRSISIGNSTFICQSSGGSSTKLLNAELFGWDLLTSAATRFTWPMANFLFVYSLWKSHWAWKFDAIRIKENEEFSGTTEIANQSISHTSPTPSGRNNYTTIILFFFLFISWIYYTLTNLYEFTCAIIHLNFCRTHASRESFAKQKSDFVCVRENQLFWIETNCARFIDPRRKGALACIFTGAYVYTLPVLVYVWVDDGCIRIPFTIRFMRMENEGYVLFILNDFDAFVEYNSYTRISPRRWTQHIMYHWA